MALLYMFRVTLNTQRSEKQHGITRQCYLQLNTTDKDKTTRILTKLQHKYTCLPERPYTALYSWWWVELSPETCRVKPLQRIKTQLLHLVVLISLLKSMMHGTTNIKLLLRVSYDSYSKHRKPFWPVYVMRTSRVSCDAENNFFYTLFGQKLSLSLKPPKYLSKIKHFTILEQTKFPCPVSQATDSHHSNALTFRHRASSIEDRRFATLQKTLFIYLINKYISLSDTRLTVHHWYK